MKRWATTRPGAAVKPKRPKQRPLGPWDARSPSRRTSHGLTPREQDALKAAQNHCCAICLEPDAPGDAALEIDHDHAIAPGKYGTRASIRGAVCGRCNRALVWFDRHAERIITYTRRKP